MGTDLKKIVELAAEGVNVFHKIVVEHGGIFQAFALSDELSALSSVSKDEVMAELKALTPAARLELLNAFKVKLDLSDKALEAKIEGGADVLDECVSLGFDGYAYVLKGIEVFEKAKALLKP